MSILPISRIKPGMKLEQAVYLPDGKCLLTAGSVITNRNVEKFREFGILEVDVADIYTLFISPSDKMEELLVEDFIHILRQISPNRPEANKNDEVVKVAAQLEGLIKKLAKNEDIVGFLVELRVIDKVRLYENGLYTAVLCGLVAGCLKLPAEEIVCAIVGGLLHDIGMAEMPSLLTLAELPPQEEALWKEHPTYGYYFALQKNIPRAIANCIQCHHENWNGSGFPKGMKEEEIPISARIIRVCAHYAHAIINKRMMPYMAIEELYGASGFYFDPKVVEAFADNIAIYPLGAMVRLSTKEVGIVSNIRKNKGPRPVVKIYYNRVNRPITEDKIVDLGQERTVFIEEIL